MKNIKTFKDFIFNSITIDKLLVENNFSKRSDYIYTRKDATVYTYYSDDWKCSIEVKGSDECFLSHDLETLENHLKIINRDSTINEILS